MRHFLRATLAAFALLIAAPGPSCAVLECRLTRSDYVAPPGTTGRVDVYLRNLDSLGVCLNGVSSDLPAEFGAGAALQGFLQSGPDSLAPYEVWQGTLLEFHVDAAAPPSKATYGVTLIGGRRRISVAPLATSFFTINDSAGVAAAREVVVPPALSPPRLRLWPNPARNLATVSVTLPAALAATVEVFDMLGRRIRRLDDRVLPPGETSIGWDGHDDSGGRAVAGIYVIEVRGESLRLRSKLAWLPR